MIDREMWSDNRQRRADKKSIETSIGEKDGNNSEARLKQAS